MLIALKVGGDLPENKSGELLKTICNRMADRSEGPETDADLKKEPAFWRGYTAEGTISDITKYLRDNKLSYTMYTGTDGDRYIDAMLAHWTPSLSEPICIASDNEGNHLIRMDLIRPLTDLLLDINVMGLTALTAPAHISCKPIADVIEKCLKNPDKVNDIIRKELGYLLPVIPELPEFRIIKRRNSK